MKKFIWCRAEVFSRMESESKGRDSWSYKPENHKEGGECACRPEEPSREAQQVLFAVELRKPGTSRWALKFSGKYAVVFVVGAATCLCGQFLFFHFCDILQGKLSFILFTL